MRIGVVTTSFPRGPDDWAGGFVAGHVSWLRSQGIDVDVVAAGDGPGRVAPGAALFYGEGAPDRLARDRRAWRWAALWSAALAAEVRRRARSWDAAVAHWLVPCGAVAAALVRRPLVAVAHSGDVHLLARTRLAAPVAALLARAGARVVFAAPAVRARFEAAAGRAARGLDAGVTPMGIDARRFAALPRRPRRGDTVLFVGRLVPVKGVDVLVDAFARVRADARLVIAGDGPEAARLRAAAGPRVEFAGEVRGAARDRLLAAADVVVVPSVEVEGGRSEGTPVVALEAMAAGVPVVATRAGGLADLPGDVVDRVPPSCPIALAAAIERGLAGDPARVARARRFALAHDWSAVGPRLVPPAIAARLAGPPGGPR